MGRGREGSNAEEEDRIDTMMGWGLRRGSDAPPEGRREMRYHQGVSQGRRLTASSREPVPIP